MKKHEELMKWAIAVAMVVGMVVVCGLAEMNLC